MRLTELVSNIYQNTVTYVVYTTLIVLCSAGVAAGQDFQDGLQLYENGRFAEAATLFEELESAEARLFAGKSYYSLGEYLRARHYLQAVSEDASDDVVLEANYTLALVDFHLDQFGRSLNTLFELKGRRPRTNLVNDSERMYEEILNYLTLAQRREAYYASETDQIKADLIRTAMGKVDYQTAQLLVNEFMQTVPSVVISNDFRQMIGDSLSYAYQVAFGTPMRAPRGTVYNIGAALPSFDNSDPQFSYSQSLYYGYVLAAEEFNQRNTDKKAFIRYGNTGVAMDSARQVMTDMAWNYNVDLLLGPLYSEPASQMASYAEQYQIPLIAPLANADDINTDNPYVFQANPTFASHGRRMAQFAVNSLGMDTLAVLAEENSFGAASAYAFRNEAERLGATVTNFFVEDLASQGYDLTDYTKFFTGDDALIDSLDAYHHIDGVYAPFTGQVAPTLSELLLVDLEAMGNRDLTILGSTEWGLADIPEERLRGRQIYYSESFYVNARNPRVELFRQNFSDRFGMEPSREAMIGYDLAHYVLGILEQIENPALFKEAIKHQPLYEGLVSNINFEGTHVNQEVKVFVISGQGIQPAEY